MNSEQKRIQRKFGWCKETRVVNTPRKMFACKITNTVTSVDLSTKYNIPVYDQTTIGSCTANAWAFAIEYDEYKQGNPHPAKPSRLMFYYCERDIDGDVNEDGGSSLTTGKQVCETIGACDESLWEYDVSKLTIKPPKSCYTAASLNKGLQFHQVGQTLTEIKAALIEGYPIVFGFQVYDDFESAAVSISGILPDPSHKSACIGGHAVIMVGFDDKKQMFKVRNSWGPSWGLNGYFWASYKYLLDPDQASDFWIVEKLTQVPVIIHVPTHITPIPITTVPVPTHITPIPITTVPVPTHITPVPVSH